MATCDDDQVPYSYTPKTETETLQRLRALVEEGLSSGAPVADTPADWSELRALAKGDPERDQSAVAGLNDDRVLAGLLVTGIYYG